MKSHPTYEEMESTRRMWKVVFTYENKGEIFLNTVYAERFAATYIWYDGAFKRFSYDPETGLVTCWLTGKDFPAKVEEFSASADGADFLHTTFTVTISMTCRSPKEATKTAAMLANMCNKRKNMDRSTCPCGMFDCPFRISKHTKRGLAICHNVTEEMWENFFQKN